MLIQSQNITTPKSQIENPSLNIHYELLDKLMVALEAEKCWLDANLTLNSLAKSLHSNREYLSRTIHHFFKKSYIDLINEYRVKSAMHLFEEIVKGESKNFTMLEVANNSGFKSTSTFNPSFRKVVGVTPSEYKNRILKGVGKK